MPFYVDNFRNKWYYVFMEKTVEKKLISMVVPCYNEQEALPIFYEEFKRIALLMEKQDFELLLVDDGSKDETLNVMKELALKDERVKYVSFSRNFGKESAIYAGIKNAKGDYVALLDADLQDPPSLLPEMFKAIKEEGYESVATRRVTRKGEPKIRSFFARRFYKIMNKVSETELVDGARDYRLMTRKFVDALLEMGEKNRFTKGMFGWVGFKTKWIEFENVQRSAGETKWSFKKLFKYAMDGIFSFSSFPMTLISFIGVFLICTGFLGTVACLICSACSLSVKSWLYFLCIGGFFTGVISTFMGIQGKYISHVYREVKQRPLYIESESNIKKDRE